MIGQVSYSDPHYYCSSTKLYTFNNKVAANTLIDQNDNTTIVFLPYTQWAKIC